MIAGPALPVVIIGAIFPTLALCTVSARLYTRLFIIHHAGPDDWVMSAAMLGNLTQLTVTMLQVRYGLGRPFVTLSPTEVTNFFITLWATIPAYNLTLLLCKISIVLSYLRIFGTSKITKICKGMLAVLVVYGCWTVIGSMLMCLPVNYFWDTSVKGHCMNKLAFWFSNAALNIVTDIMILTIPMPVVKELRLPKKQRLGLMAVFGVGAFICVTSVIRLKSLYEISISTDTSLDGVSTGVWSLIESTVAIICGSLPALKPLIAKAFPKLLSSSGSRPGASQTGGAGISMNTFSRKSRGTKLEEGIVVESTIHQSAEGMNDTGSEKSLVNYKANCYAKETEIKSPLDTADFNRS